MCSILYGSAANASLGSYTRSKTIPFGGKIITKKIPTVTCEPPDGGSVPVVLGSNLAGLGQAGASAVSGQQGTLQKINNIGVGIYKAIPLYVRPGIATGRPSPRPKIGDWILGNQNLIPDLNTCQTNIFGAPIPFPVVKTGEYGISRPVKK